MRKPLIVIIAATCFMPLFSMNILTSNHNQILPISSHVQNKMLVIPLRDDEINHEQLNVDEEEPLTQTRYSELIQHKHNLNQNYLLGRVETYDSRTKNQFIHYYDANSLNEWLGGYNRPRFKFSWEYKNPLNNLPIRDIDYFSVTPKDPDKCVFIAGYIDFEISANDPNALWKEIFYENPSLTLLQIARQYRWGSKFITQDPHKAYQCYEELAQQNINPTLASHANECLAYMCLQGEGREKNSTMAAAHFKAMHEVPNRSRETALRATYALAQIYYEQRPYNHSEAHLYLNQAVGCCRTVINDPQSATNDILIAKMYLGCLYYKYAVASRDYYTYAERYFNEVATQQDNLEYARKAQENLNVMHCWCRRYAYNLKALYWRRYYHNNRNNH